MATGYILYNSIAGNGQHSAAVEALKESLKGDLQLLSTSKITNYGAFVRGLEKDDYIILAGGDGTLNRFVNDTDGLEISQEILYYPAGNGNDFAHDVGKADVDHPFSIKEYLKDLPSVEVKGKKYRFLNGVGYGIDGYCCEVGDELRIKKPEKKANYTSIAIKGLLFHFKPSNATVTVDGVEHTYKKVWVAPTMYGRFYGGGMMPTPDQDRMSKDKKLSTMIFYGKGRLRSLIVFPSIFKGTHVAHTDMVDVLTGHEIKVAFDHPTSLQIDGETILNVSSYTARSAVCEKAKKAESVMA